MKILKIFGVVMGIHVFAFVLIIANPGCSSTTKPAPKVADTAPKPGPAPTITVPLAAHAGDTSSSPTIIAFNPDAPATSAPAPVASGARMVPTRPDSPVAGLLVAPPVGDVTPATSYTVKSGDSLWTVAKKNSLTVAQLASANGLANNASLRPGQKLKIPSRPPAAETPAAAKAADTAAATATLSSAKPSDVVKHTVKSGDTLGAIARTYGVRQGDIAVANNISDPAKIRPGMELIIPGWNAAGARFGKSPTKASAATKGSEPKPPLSIELPPAAETPATPPPATVPVIKIDESPVAPAPRP